ncbi:hypothetical protein [Spiroplasma endosymbiont of Andrena trimmerana]
MVEANQPRFWLAVAFTPLGWVAKQRGAKPLYTCWCYYYWLCCSFIWND